MSAPNTSGPLALVATVLALAPACVATAQPQDPGSSAQDAITATVASVDPRVPPAAGQPCVVELLHNRPLPQPGVHMVIDPAIVYTPPTACPPPWSKVILKMDVQTTRRTVVDSIGMDLARVRLFRSGAPHYDGLSSWHVERDLTDYSALFRAPHAGRVWTAQNPEAVDWGWDYLQPVYHASARLLFYPSTAATPAPRVPDMVIGVDQDTPVALPHNIVRAYLDVENSFATPATDAVWFTCWSDDSAGLPLGDIFAPGTNPKYSNNPPDQGCGGGSFRELQVTVDGTLAAVAPAFPLVIADLNWWYLRNSTDLPIPTLEMLNAKPYRLDLTPFAAILSAAGPHGITTSNAPLNEGEGRPGGATLLLYQDRQRAQVTGAVTLNTLATENGAPTDVNTIAQRFGTTQGGIRTRQQRDFVIRGFVNTSIGRIDSSVHQTDDFSTLQDFRLQGPQWPENYDPVDKVYFQDVWLTSSTVQISRRSRGGQLISWDKITTSYPLQLTWHVASTVQIGDGLAAEFRRTHVTVQQSRVIDGDHYKPGLGHFTTHAGARLYSVRKDGTQDTTPRWESFTTRNYLDSFGSCYHGYLTSRDGAILGMTEGVSCPGDRNHVLWFAHPDGSADTLGWWH